MKKIILERELEGPRYKASIPGTNQRGYGTSPDNAIGHMVGTFSKELGFEIEFSELKCDPIGSIQLPEGDGIFDPSGAEDLTPSHHKPNHCP